METTSTVLLHLHNSFTFLRNPSLPTLNPRNTNGCNNNTRRVRPHPSIPKPRSIINRRCRRHPRIVQFQETQMEESPSPGSWLDGSDLFQRLASGVVAAVALLFLNFGAAEAHDGGGPSVPPTYPCEDVAHYYSNLDRLEGAALMRRLGSIVSVHRSLPYKEVWDALKVLDAANIDDPENSSEVIEIYSLRAVSKLLAGKPEGWNREHLWPRSYGLVEAPSLTDLHNLRPADVNVNSSRGNKYYGECLSESTECLRPANSEAAPDTETDKERWVPPFQVRGDIARSLMYMAVCYGFHQPGVGPHLQLSDSPSIENREMGLLSALLRWNELDPPSRAEKLRNDRICRLYQHNRNPFIDHPEYANLLWKHITPSNTIAYKPSSKAWINEFHYNSKGKDINEFVEVVIGQWTDSSEFKLLLYNGSNGKIYRSLHLRDSRVFTVTSCGSGFFIYTAYHLPLQNGPRDGIALVSVGDGGRSEVVQFLSYEGTLKGVDGPANGIESVDVVVRETEASSEYDSLGLTGVSRVGFQWRKFEGEATPGRPNIGQRL